MTTGRADGVENAELGFGWASGLGFQFDRVKLTGAQHHHIGQAGDRAQTLVDCRLFGPAKSAGERVPEECSRHGAAFQMVKDSFLNLLFRHGTPPARRFASSAAPSGVDGRPCGSRSRARCSTCSGQPCCSAETRGHGRIACVGVALRCRAYGSAERLRRRCHQKTGRWWRCSSGREPQARRFRRGGDSAGGRARSWRHPQQEIGDVERIVRLLVGFGRRDDFVAPSVPPWPRLAGEQLDLRQLGIHALDQRISLVGLAAVLAARCCDYRRRARSFREGGGMLPRAAMSKVSC